MYMPGPGGTGRVASLVHITRNGTPIYAIAHNISAADTIGTDQLWVPGRISSVVNWPTGGNRFNNINLDGAGVTVGMWEVEFETGSAAAQTTHQQLNGRTTRLDSTLPGLSRHATAVAGTIASGGLDAFGTVNGHSFNLGDHSSGMAFASTLHSYDTLSLATEFSLEARTTSTRTPGGLRLSNHSYGLISGWQQFVSGGPWYWYGEGSDQQDWKFGAYMEVADGIAPYEWDANANAAPYSLMVVSAGNEQNDGPGSLPPGGYFAWDGTQWVGGQTATRDWNDGDDGGYDSLPPGGCAKNVLTVGAVYDLIDGHLAPPGNIVLAPFSSFGPTDDGRIKPDVVACGIRTGTGVRNPEGFTALLTLDCDPANPGDNFYYNLWGGTSFSAPTVAGSLALVLQLRNQLQPSWGAVDFKWPIRSSTLRALAIHNAREAGPDPANPAPGPDFKFGYGLFDAVATSQLVGNDAVAPFNPNGGHPKPYVKEVLLPETKYIQFRARIPGSPSGPLKATICWNDPVGDPQTEGVRDEQTKRLINDLDVRIFPPGTTVFNPEPAGTVRPYILNPDLTGQNPANRGAAAATGDDSINNVEQVVVNNPTAGSDYIVRITHKGVSLLPNGQQWVSIIISGADVIPAPDLVLTATSGGGNNVNITWPAVVSGIYRIQGRANFTDPWTDATGDISANLETMTATVQAPTSPYFWRGVRYY